MKQREREKTKESKLKTTQNTHPLKRTVSIDLSVNVTIYLLQHMVVRWQYYCQLML